MNPLNYASLEASKRLVEAGIVLGTEVCWSPIFDFNMSSVGKPVPIKDWELMRCEHINGSMWALKAIPAPSMAEVWRELPKEAILHIYFDSRGTVIEYRLASLTICVAKTVYDTNPTDALIDLLIWVRKEKGK